MAASRKKRRRRPKMRRTRPDRRVSGAFGDGDLVAQSIENMYRIVEPWQKQGERVAKQLSRAYGSIEIPEGTRDVHGRFLHSGGELLASWIDLLTFYTEWFMSRGGSSTLGAGALFGAESLLGAGSLQTEELIFEVKSKRKIRLTGDVERHVEAEALEAPNISGRTGIQVTFTSHNGQVVAKVKVKKSARRGMFISDIVDAYSDELLGRICIEVT